MDDTNTPTPAEPAPSKRARQRPPKSKDAKMRGLAARKLQRALEAVKASKNVAKMEEAAGLLAQLDGDAQQEPPRAEATPAPEAAAPTETQPAELRGTPAGVDTGRPGWPSDKTIAEFAPLAQHVVQQLATVLAPTRYAIHERVRVSVGETVVETSKADTLSAALAPVLAKYLPNAINTPEAALVVACVTIFGVPAINHAVEKYAASRGGA